MTSSLRKIARLRAPLGVYALWTNQDKANCGHSSEVRRFERELDDAGVVVLGNRGVSVLGDLFLNGVHADHVRSM